MGEWEPKNLNFKRFSEKCKFLCFCKRNVLKKTKIPLFLRKHTQPGPEFFLTNFRSSAVTTSNVLEEVACSHSILPIIGVGITLNPPDIGSRDSTSERAKRKYEESFVF